MGNTCEVSTILKIPTFYFSNSPRFLSFSLWKKLRSKLFIPLVSPEIERERFQISLHPRISIWKRRQSTTLNPPPSGFPRTRWNRVVHVTDPRGRIGRGSAWARRNSKRSPKRDGGPRINYHPALNLAVNTRSLAGGEQSSKDAPAGKHPRACSRLNLVAGSSLVALEQFINDQGAGHASITGLVPFLRVLTSRARQRWWARRIGNGERAETGE